MPVDEDEETVATSNVMVTNDDNNICERDQLYYKHFAMVIFPSLKNYIYSSWCFRYSCK